MRDQTSERRDKSVFDQPDVEMLGLNGWVDAALMVIVAVLVVFYSCT